MHALEPGEFILGYPDEDGPVANLPEPEVLSRNGSYMAYRRLQEHVGAFRDYLRENADTPEGEELLAAKFMGRWRSGAPLVLAPDKDDPELGADPMRNNDFNYKEMDPARLCVPARIACAQAQSARHRALHEPASDDPPGRDLRTRAARRCARRRRGPRHRRIHHLRQPDPPVRVRPERVDQRQTFHELGNEHDPICGTQDGTLDFTVPKRPIRKVHKGLPAFTTLQGGAYFFLPGINATALPRRARRLEGSPCPSAARTYNQSHVPRAHTGGRRISIYWTWSYPWEAQRDPASIENRFSTMTEVRNVLWPAYETPEYDAANFLQGIAGTLELFHRSALAFQELAEEATGHPVAVFQRIDQAGYKLPIDERVLADTDTLMVFGLDHLLSEQEAAPEEIAAITEWLKREGTCLLLAPHHDVGFTDDYGQRQVEYEHHGDRLVPRQQRFSQYTRSLMKALDVPVHNIWGLRPAVVEGTKEIAPLTGIRDLDTARLLDNVTTFNFHPHLPHYELTAPESDALRVLGRQRVDPNRPHPVHRSGQHGVQRADLDAACGQRAGDIVLIDSTHFTTLFGGTDSLRNLWHNLATMK